MNQLARCKPLLGTFVEINLKGDCSDDQLIAYSEQAFSKIQAVESALSYFQADSELSRFNHWARNQPTDSFTLSSLFTEVLTLALKLHRQSLGIFDVAIAPALFGLAPVIDSATLANNSSETLLWGSSDDIILKDNQVWISKPVCLDLGGIAKGYAVDCAINCLPQSIKITINAGGDLRANHWQQENVLIRYGRAPWQQKSIAMQNCALATSGNYLRKQSLFSFWNNNLMGNNPVHINPFKQKSVHRSGAISVFADNAMIADALTKAVWLMPTTKIPALLAEYQASAWRINPFGWAKCF